MKTFVALCVLGCVLAIGHRVLTTAPPPAPRQHESSQQGLRMQEAFRQTRAATLCQEEARHHARHPSTASMWWFETRATRPDGSLLIGGTMTAANSFGLRLDHHVTCVVHRGAVQQIAVTEAR